MKALPFAAQIIAQSAGMLGYFGYLAAKPPPPIKPMPTWPVLKETIIMTWSDHRGVQTMKKISERAVELMVARNKGDLIGGGDPKTLESLAEVEQYAGCITWYDYMKKNAPTYPAPHHVNTGDVLQALDEYQEVQSLGRSYGLLRGE